MRISNPIAVIGEDAAVSFLRLKDYHILERNFRRNYGEIDIIAVSPDKKILVFVEVKTRKSNAYGTPAEAISYYKMQSLLKTLQFYKATHYHLPDALRLDAISVTLTNDNKIATIEHIENISM